LIRNCKRISPQHYLRDLFTASLPVNRLWREGTAGEQHIQALP
jgi:hypothetical protein